MIHHVVTSQEDNCLRTEVEIFHDLESASVAYQRCMENYEWHMQSKSNFANRYLEKPTLVSVEIACFDNRDDYYSEDMPFVRTGVVLIGGVEVPVCHKD